MIFVTHDQEEAMAISDRIAIMNQGKIMQIGSAEELYYEPNGEFVSKFIGRINQLPAEIQEINQDYISISIFKRNYKIKKKVDRGFQNKQKIEVYIRPEFITFSPEVNEGQLKGKILEKTFLGEKVEQGEVLYLALEDNPRRIQSRAAAMKLPECPITFEFYWRPLQEDGLNDLYLECERERYRLIIIDTLARVIPGINLNDENPIATIVNDLQSMALNHGLTILPAHHTRKSNGIWADPIDDIMGSTAISRAIDAVLAIYRQQGKAGMLLKGRGRDTEEFDLAVNFDGLTKCWQSLGDAEEVLLSETKQEILSYLEGAGKSSLASIAQGLGKDKSNVNKNLQDLTNDGKVRKEYIEGKVFYEKV